MKGALLKAAMWLTATAEYWLGEYYGWLDHRHYKWELETGRREPYDPHANCTILHSATCLAMTNYTPLLGDNIFSGKPLHWGPFDERV